MNAFFSRRGLSIDRLLSFIEVADAGGFAAAAPDKIARQNQLSRQVGDLEDFFATPLVERRTKGIVLTEAGRELAVTLREAFARMQDIHAKASSEPTYVRLGCGESVYHWWVIPCGDAFGDTCVESTVLSGPEVIAGLFDAQLDFGIVRTSDLRPGLRSRLIGEIDYALYVPHALVPDSTPLDVKELLAVIPIGILTGEPSFSERLETSLKRARVKFRKGWVSETFPKLCRAVAKGRIAAVLPTFARDELPSSHFHELKHPVLGKHERPMNLVWMPRLERQRPDVAALVPGIVARMQQYRKGAGPRDQ